MEFRDYVDIRIKTKRERRIMQAYENTEGFDLEALQAELETRYGTAAAQGIMDRLSPHKNMMTEPKTNRAPEYMDVKAMSELAERFRAHAMTAVWRLKAWRNAQSPSNPFQKNLVQLEGAMLKRQCQEAFKLYRLSNQTYFSMYREAMDAFSKPATLKTTYHKGQAA